MDGEQAPRWRVGDQVQIKGVTLTVSELDIAWLPRIRDHLIEHAAGGGTTTYGDLKRDLGLPHATNGLGRLLDLVGEDCARRDEPSLASLVVSRSTGEVGADFEGDAEHLRERVHRHWHAAAAVGESIATAHSFTLNGTRRSLDGATVRNRLRGVPAHGLQRHWVDIDGRRFPPKQAFRVALGLGQDEPFISHFAIRVFRRLGFETSPLPDEPRIEQAPHAGAAPSAEAAGTTNPHPLLTAEDAVLAFQRLDAFLSTAPLTVTLAHLEGRLKGATATTAGRLAADIGFDEDLVDSALVIRERVGILDTLIHAAVIAQVLPLILEEGETVTKRPSLGAGNDPDRVFDLETSHRVAEFKLSSWKGSDGGRQRGLFADVVGLSLDDTGRRREVYVVGPLPVKFLQTSNRNAAKTLSKAALRLRTPAGLTDDMTVSEFTHAADIHVVDLAKLLPRLR
jgi:hypothetical protein